MPIQLSKKMWAASEVKVLEQVKVDDRLLIKRAPFIVSLKQGNTGELAFATEATQPLKDGVSIIEETKTIAYKLAVSSQPSTARKVLWEETSEPLISQDLALDEVTLYFLLIIVHQIHYAPPYTTKIEKYPDLVIHSPLLIQLPLNLYRSQPPSTMTDHYMASSTLPNFLGASLAINLAPCYRHVLLWASNYEVQPTLVINVQSWLFN
ncbi:hypothetical protein QO209_23535 [Pseudomonas citronellolis]|uniref:hypothetical protein n=1 Tax=Pseudomonas citronellolis TaxID=53408 RepID=UPI002649E33B|nr:hypothetical protein [Pseudomonas citronellolis]MDN6875423.1 hypothetical protein [Pseudomonas citronellolis]